MKRQTNEEDCLSLSFSNLFNISFEYGLPTGDERLLYCLSEIAVVLMWHGERLKQIFRLEFKRDTVVKVTATEKVQWQAAPYRNCYGVKQYL